MYTFDAFQVMSSQELPLLSNIHLLIVEDMRADVELIAIALEAANIKFSYDTTDNLDNCQRWLQAKTYDAVLTDYRSPQFTAYQVLKSLKQSKQKIPLILITGNLGEEAAVECIKAGMTDYLLKERLFRLPIILKRSLQEFELRRQQQVTVAQIQQQIWRETIINRIVQAMRETLVIDEILQTTVDLVQEALQLSRCIILRPDVNKQLRAKSVSELSFEREIFINNQCLLVEYYQDKLSRGEQVCIPNKAEIVDPQLCSIAKQFSLKAILISPLMYQQELIGALCLHQCDRPREWTNEEISLVKAISDQCAIAVHQAQLFRQVQQQATREQTLNQISRAINSSLDPTYILQEIVKLTGECFGVDRVIIVLIDQEQIRLINEWRANDQVVYMGNFVAPRSGWPDLIDPNSDFLCRRVFHAPDYTKVSSTPTRLMQIQQTQVFSVLSAPIFIRDQLFGGLTLHTTTNYRTFTADEIQLLQGIADQAAIALYNAQSYEILEELVKQRTQELEIEKQLSEAANRAKTEFLHNMSHELRTPLTGILGFSSILLEQVFGTLNPKQKQYIELISSSGKHLLELINDLLDLSRIEAGKEELYLETLVVEEVCSACLSMFKEKIEQKNLQLIQAIAPNITTCIGDRRRLKQILVNLLSNAIKFTDSGSVSLKVEQTRSEIQFSVIDTGIGVTIEDIENLFQPFHQLDSGLNRKYEGTGLGLALSRKLARLHGGDITVKSELGHGSCFTLHLPQ